MPSKAVMPSLMATRLPTVWGHGSQWVNHSLTVKRHVFEMCTGLAECNIFFLNLVCMDYDSFSS